MEDIVVQSTSAAWIYLVYIVVALFAIAAFGLLLSFLKKRLFKPQLYGITREEVQKRWVMIRQTSAQGVMGAKLAVMEADTLLDTALKSLAMSGQTLGERLKFACYKYPNLRNVWWAHKLRNQLVHESSFNLSTREAQRALDEYERALKMMNVM